MNALPNSFIATERRSPEFFSDFLEAVHPCPRGHKNFEIPVNTEKSKILFLKVIVSYLDFYSDHENIVQSYISHTVLMIETKINKKISKICCSHNFLRNSSYFCPLTQWLFVETSQLLMLWNDFENQNRIQIRTSVAEIEQFPFVDTCK